LEAIGASRDLGVCEDGLDDRLAAAVELATFGPANDPTGGAALFRATDVSDLLLARSGTLSRRMASYAFLGVIRTVRHR
jgi:hypothetical protein